MTRRRALVGLALAGALAALAPSWTAVRAAQSLGVLRGRLDIRRVAALPMPKASTEDL